MCLVCACGTEEQLLAVLRSVTNRDLCHCLDRSILGSNSFTTAATCRKVIVAFFACLQEVANTRREVRNRVVTLRCSEVEHFRLQYGYCKAADRREEDVWLDTSNDACSTDSI